MSSKSDKRFFGVGVFLLSVAFLCNEKTLARFSSDGNIEGISVIFSIRMAQCAMGLAGMAIVFSRTRKACIVAKILFLICIICSVLAFFEIFLVKSGLPPKIVSGWRWKYPVTEKNELGFRGHSLYCEEGAKVVVFLGDSQVEAKACSYGFMPERRLELALREGIGNVRVVSLGASGYGQDQQLLALREYFDKGYRADLVVLWQTIANDVWNNTFPTHGPTNGSLKPTFVLRDGKLDPDPKLLKIPEKLHVVRLFSDQKFRRLDDVWGQEFLPESYQPDDNVSQPVENWPKLIDRLISGRDNFTNDKNHLSLALDPRSPRVAYGIRLTRKLLFLIEEEAKNYHADLILFRTEKRVDQSSLFAESDEVSFKTSEGVYCLSKRQHEKSVEEILEGFVTVSIPVTVYPSDVGPEDGHLNEHATAQVMKDLGKLLLDKKMFSESGERLE